MLQLSSIGVPNEEQNRQALRELLFTAPDIEEHISGVVSFLSFQLWPGYNRDLAKALSASWCGAAEVHNQNELMLELMHVSCRGSRTPTCACIASCSIEQGLQMSPGTAEFPEM